jgi:hypothetical protein
MSDSDAPEEVSFGAAESRSQSASRAALSGARKRKRAAKPVAPLLHIPVAIAQPPAGLGDDAALAAAVGASLSRGAGAGEEEAPPVDAAEARRDRRRAARAREARRARREREAGDGGGGGTELAARRAAAAAAGLEVVVAEAQRRGGGGGRAAAPPPQATAALTFLEARLGAGRLPRQGKAVPLPVPR